jgi:S-layer protein (TIGR01567 family)
MRRYLSIWKLAVVIALVLQSAAAVSGWSIQTIGWGYEGTSLALDSSSNPHISYKYSNGNQNYAEWTGSVWNIQTVDSTQYAGEHSSIALDSSGNPHISYRDGYSGMLKYAKWTGSAWSIQTIDSGGYDSSIALDSSGNPYISYFDGYPNSDLKYAKWTGSTWSIQTIDSEGSVGLHTSIALDSSGNPHISYYDFTNHNLKYAKWKGTEWSNQTVDSGWFGTSSSLALDSSGNPHISYSNGSNMKYVKWTGTEWSNQTVDSGWFDTFSSLALDSSGNPHISYSGNNLKYARWTGIMWSIQIVDLVRGQYSSLALDSSGNPHISYTVFDGNLKYASYSATTPVLAIIDYPNNNSSYLQGEMVMLKGSASGGIPLYNYSWTSSIDGFIGNESKIFDFSLSPGTHKITMAVNDSSGLTNSTTINPANTINISGQSATGVMTWKASNFPALTTETLNVVSMTSRIIEGNGLYYSTSKQLVPYKVFSATGNTVVNGEDGGRSYAKVGWFGKTYVALRGQTRKLTKPILEQNETENKILFVGETWDMGDGYTLKLMGIDAKALPIQAWIMLNKSGIELDEKIIQPDSVYTYLERSIGGESDVPLFVTYFDNISTNSVRLKYSWLISGNNILELSGGDRIGNLEVVEASTDTIKMTNIYTITLTQNSKQNIAKVLRFNVNNTPTLDYYPEMTVITPIPTPTPSITGVIITPTTPSAGAEINITVAINNPGASFNGRVEGNVWSPSGTGKYLGWENVSIPSGVSTVTIIGPAGGAESSYITHQAGTYLYDVFLENVDKGQVYLNPTDSKTGVAFSVGAAVSVYISNIVLSASPTVGTVITLNVTISNPTTSAFTGTMDANIWDSVRGYALTPQPISIAAGGSTTLTFSYTPVNHGLHSYDFFMVSDISGQNTKAPWAFACMDYVAGTGFTVV